MKLIARQAFKIFYTYLCPIPLCFQFDFVRSEFSVPRGILKRSAAYFAHLFVLCEFLFLNFSLFKVLSTTKLVTESQSGYYYSYTMLVILQDMVLVDSCLCLLTFLVKARSVVCLIGSVQSSTAKRNVWGKLYSFQSCC